MPCPGCVLRRHNAVSRIWLSCGLQGRAKENCQVIMKAELIKITRTRSLVICAPEFDPVLASFLLFFLLPLIRPPLSCFLRLSQVQPCRMSDDLPTPAHLGFVIRKQDRFKRRWKHVICLDV